jgi:hypothetical protein
MGLDYGRWYKGLIECTAQHGVAEMRCYDVVMCEPEDLRLRG